VVGGTAGGAPGGVVGDGAVGVAGTPGGWSAGVVGCGVVTGGEFCGGVVCAKVSGVATIAQAATAAKSASLMRKSPEGRRKLRHRREPAVAPQGFVRQPQLSATEFLICEARSLEAARALGKMAPKRSSHV